jgi:mono/diheme cytochrome c family protein
MMSEKRLASLSWRSVFMLAAMAGLWAALPTAADAAGDAKAGEQLFQQKGCTACHTIGKGDLVGPDLKGVTEKRPHDWLVQWISAPDQMVAKKDDYAIKLLQQYHNVQMPNLGLSATDVDNIRAFLASPGAASAASGPAPQAAGAPAVKGNPEIGKDLFTGVVRFQNGGPPCMACHSVSGIGALGGGQLGPDLTEAVKRYGGASAVDAFIAGTPTPTMKAVWGQRPLTAGDRANVVSFLAQAEVSQRPAQAIWQLAGLAALGVVILLALAAFKWSHRLRFGVRRPMMAKPTTGHTDPRNGGWFSGPYHPGWKARFTSQQ